MTDRSGRRLRRLDQGMAAAGLLALVAVTAEHGLLVTPPQRHVLHFVEATCVLIFGALQAAKLLAVERPLEYLRSRRLDFSLLFLLVVQTVALGALVSSSEHRYLWDRGLPSPISAFYVTVLQVYLVLIVGLRSPLLHRVLLSLRLRPVQMLVVSFLLLIVAGTALLALPGASAGGRPLPVIDALFTSTSAVCVTGLAVRDTGTQFTPLGLSVLLALIQAGGLGMLTITTSFALFGGRGVTASEATALAAAVQVDADAMRPALVRIFATTLAVEGLGTLLLFALWTGVEPEPLTRLGWAAFHAVSAFCNAGFALFTEHASLTTLAEHTPTLGVIAGLIVLGGLGFGVLADITGRVVSRRRTPLGRHSRWVLGTTGVLLATGTAAFWFAERDGALAAFAGPSTWLNAAFQSVTLRTAGFQTMDLSDLGLPAVVLCTIWMLIGGSPSSTAGGLKTTTCAVALAGALRLAAFDRPLVRRALRLAAIYVGVWIVFVALLALAQGQIDRRIVFEAASAFATVGLSMGATAELTSAGKLVLCAAMFAGRVGPFALAATLVGMRPQEEEPTPAETILLG